MTAPIDIRLAATIALGILWARVISGAATQAIRIYADAAAPEIRGARIAAYAIAFGLMAGLVMSSMYIWWLS